MGNRGARAKGLEVATLTVEQSVNGIIQVVGETISSLVNRSINGTKTAANPCSRTAFIDRTSHEIDYIWSISRPQRRAGAVVIRVLI